MTAVSCRRRMLQTIDNIHRWSIGNHKHQHIATFNLSPDSFMRIETPITRQAQTMTIQTHRPNRNLTHPIRSHLLTIPEDSDLKALGIPIIEDGLGDYTVIRIETYFLYKHSMNRPCTYRIGLMLHEDTPDTPDIAFVYPISKPKQTPPTLGEFQPS